MGPDESPPPEPLIRAVDSVQLPVPDLDVGLAFYRDRLGHALLWRRATAAGLRLPDDGAEVVLRTQPEGAEVDLLVRSADAATEAVVAAGGRVRVEPFDIPVGRCVVVEDPWGNALVLLDMTKGKLATDADGNVVGNMQP